MEYIGRVRLNYDCYSGSDLYSDGDMEDLLLSIVKEECEYDAAIMENPFWPVLYHLSDIRENVVRWIPLKKTDSVLEIGAGCGAVTGALLQRCKDVVCVELSKKRSRINAYRHRDAENLEIMVGNFSDVKDHLKQKFDYITLIGVYEYASLYTKEDDAGRVLLQQVKKLLKPEGRLILAIENRLGLKYFAGCREDHLGMYFQGIENNYSKDGVRTFSRKEIVTLLESGGFVDYQFYYPYPDYKLPEMIYSDGYLPKKGELVKNIRNFDADRLVLFDETKAWDGILEAGLFHEFSNSFIVTATADTDTVTDEPVYAKYAVERAKDYQIITRILRRADDGYVVHKAALTDAAAVHVTKMKKAYLDLSSLFTHTNVNVAECTQADMCSVEIPFIGGSNLECLLDEYIEQERQEQAADLIQRFFDEFLENVQKVPFTYSEDFAAVFGKTSGFHADMSLPVTNADIIFSNFVVQGREFIMLDYEWTFWFPIPLQFILYRALFHSYAFQKLEDRFQKKLYLYAGIQEKDMPLYLEMEFSFQRYVKKDRIELETLYQRMHTHAWNMSQFHPKGFHAEYQVYFDGRLAEWKDTQERDIRFQSRIPDGTEQIRIVLNDQNGIYKICSIFSEGDNGRCKIADYKSNAQLIIIDDFYFTDTPEVVIKNNRYHAIDVTYQVLEAGSSCMEQMITALKDAEHYRQAYHTAELVCKEYQQAYHTADLVCKEYEQAYHTADLACKEYEQAYHTADLACKEYQQAYHTADLTCKEYQQAYDTSVQIAEDYRRKIETLEEEVEQIHNKLWWKLGRKIERITGQKQC
ncbi:MAG: class I SAM-dependent methyltransferase [Eubacterium sp.]|nr:class I SAM-dependent methyltransferase [Eubacterium sp.]